MNIEIVDQRRIFKNNIDLIIASYKSVLKDSQVCGISVSLSAQLY